MKSFISTGYLERQSHNPRDFIHPEPQKATRVSITKGLEVLKTMKSSNQWINNLVLFIILSVNFLFFWKDFLTTEYTECTEPESFILLKAKKFQTIKSLIQISAFSVHSVVKKNLWLRLCHSR